MVKGRGRMRAVRREERVALDAGAAWAVKEGVAARVSKMMGRGRGGEAASIGVRGGRGRPVGRVGATVVVERSVGLIGDLGGVVLGVVEANERLEGVFLQLQIEKRRGRVSVGGKQVSLRKGRKNERLTQRAHPPPSQR